MTQLKCTRMCNKKTCTRMFVIALFAKARIWKKPKCLATEEINCGIFIQ